MLVECGQPLERQMSGPIGGHMFAYIDGYETFLSLFVLRLNVPVNNFSVMSGWSHRFLGITSTFRE